MNSKLREEIKGILQNHGCIECREWEDGGRNDEKAEQNLLALFERQLVEERLESQLNGVAWAVGVIDDMHFGLSNTDGNDVDLDRTFKGIKNTLRDRYKDITGIDPAPSYPIHAQLKANKSREE